MFTNNTYINRSLRPQLDLTIKTFIQSRNNKRVRRFKKIIFRKMRRLRRDRRPARSPSVVTQGKKKGKVLSVFFKNRHKRRRGLVTIPVLRLMLSLVDTKSYSRNTATLRDIRTKGPRRSTSKPNYLVSWVRNLYTHRRLSEHLNVVRALSGWKTLAVQSMMLRNNSLTRIYQKFHSNMHKLTLSRQAISATLKKRTHPYIRPRTGKNFIFKNFGIFLTSFIFLNQKKPFSYKYLFKKKIFSFLYPNEVRNSLMARKKRITFYQLVYKLKHRSKQKTHYSFASFNKFFINHYKTSLQNTSNISITRELFTKLPLQQDASTLNLPNYTASRDEILYDQNFSHRGVDLSFKRSEVRIPRVRFRPGYQRMWRSARNALKESMGLRFVYQQQLTRCLVRFYKNSNKYSFSRSEMSANRVIMYSRLLPDNPTVDIFIEQKLIYLNGRLLHTPQSILVSNDIVQLIVSV
jgi:hypothetical protein